MLTILLFTACNPVDKSDSGEDTPVERASCEVPLPVIDWSDSGMPTEGLEGVEDELALIDLSQLSDPVDISELLPLFRGLIAYAIEIAPADLPNELTHQQALQAGKLGEVVLASLLLGQEDGSGMDVSFFRRGFHHYYTCSRAFPTTLEGLQEVYGSYNSAQGRIVDSIAKCGDRNLLTVGTDVFVAESLVDGVVRETEVLLRNQRTDGQLEFLVYDVNGHLTNRTQFPTVGNGPHVVTSAPYACMTCHLNAESTPTTWSYDVLMPATGPCM